MKKVGEEQEDVVEVEDTLCDRLSRPVDHNYCHVPCPGQCVVTDWTPWSACPQVLLSAYYIEYFVLYNVVITFALIAGDAFFLQSDLMRIWQNWF